MIGKALMIQGTGSGVGKSLMVTALCRIFRDMDMDVAPFKAQNMALNAQVTKEGGEIGVAQALQARAARIEPGIDMNPILLKPSGRAGVQVVIHGKAYSTMKASGYYGFKNHALNAVRSSFDRLSKSHELIIIEGAGSPAEINLMKDDIVNMAMARYANAPVLLVGDIDKGGVFASFYGTVKLLGRDSRYIKGFIINKFRGDLNLLRPALEMIRTKTGKPVIGVIPYLHGIGLPEEDGVSLEEIQNSKLKIQDSGLGIQDPIKIVVVKLRYISNFTDLDPFYCEPDVDLVFSDNPSIIRQADIVIIPGSKNTMDDLVFLRSTGIDQAIKDAYMKGTQIIGICGGYQMLGERLLNPYGVEGKIKESDGIGILNIKTVFQKDKITSQVEAEIIQGPGLEVESLKGTRLKGYEIHHGISTGDIEVFRLRRVPSQNTNFPHFRKRGMGGFDMHDGSVHKNCFGTYIHGIFDNDQFRRAILNSVKIKKGVKPVEHIYSYEEARDKAIDRFADIVKRHLDMEFIKRLIRV